MVVPREDLLELLDKYSGVLRYAWDYIDGSFVLSRDEYLSQGAALTEVIDFVRSYRRAEEAKEKGGIFKLIANMFRR